MDTQTPDTTKLDKPKTDTKKKRNKNGEQIKEKMIKLEKKQAQLKAELQAFNNREKERLRKKRSRCLILMGTLLDTIIKKGRLDIEILKEEINDMPKKNDIKMINSYLFPENENEIDTPETPDVNSDTPETENIDDSDDDLYPD